MTTTYHECPCPHPECNATIKVRGNVQSGTYQCLCHACTVKLTWATYLNEGRKPYLTLVENKQQDY